MKLVKASFILSQIVLLTIACGRQVPFKGETEKSSNRTSEDQVVAQPAPVEPSAPPAAVEPKPEPVRNPENPLNEQHARGEALVVPPGQETPKFARINEGVEYGDRCVAGTRGDFAHVKAVDAVRKVATLEVFCSQKLDTVELPLDKLTAITGYDSVRAVEEVNFAVTAAPRAIETSSADSASRAAASAEPCSAYLTQIRQNQITQFSASNCRNPQEEYATESKRKELDDRIASLYKVILAQMHANYQNAHQALQNAHAAYQQTQMAFILANSIQVDQGGFWGKHGLSGKLGIEENFAEKYDDVNGALVASAIGIQAQMNAYASVPPPDSNLAYSQATAAVMKRYCAISRTYFNNGGRKGGIELAYAVKTYGAKQVDVKFAQGAGDMLPQKKDQLDYQNWGGIFYTKDVTFQTADVTYLPLSTLVPSSAAMKGLMTTFFTPLDSEGVGLTNAACTFMQGLL